MWLGKIFFTFLLNYSHNPTLRKKKADHCSPEEKVMFIRYKHKENTEHLKIHHYNSLR